MSDYTPTTEEVSGAYNFWLQQCSEETVEEITEKFDRWLAEVKAQAWEEGYNAKWVETYFYDNPYRIIISAKDYDQLRKALDQ